MLQTRIYVIGYLGRVVGELQATTTEPEDGVHWFHQVRPTLIPEVDIDHAG